MVNLPLFHVGGTAAVYAMLALGGSIARRRGVRHRHRSGDVVGESRTTSCVLLGVMATFLAKQPPGPQDRNHTLHQRHHGAAVRGRRGVPPSASAATSIPSST